VNLPNTPQLNTPFTMSLEFLEELFLKNKELIQEWFTAQWQNSPAPFYGSVDLRNAGFKLAPIDMNLFPAGFNNLNREFLPLAVKAAKKTVEHIHANVKNILIIPESHTRNLFYWSNIQTLLTILEQAGFATRLGVLDLAEPQVIQLSDAQHLTLYPLRREQNELSVIDFKPDLILLNNDLSEGMPDILLNISQKIIPPAELGWHQRLKSEHFQYYEQVAKEFAAVLKMDAWLISPLFRHCGKIDFLQQGGMECLIANAENLFQDLTAKYAEYNLPLQPFLIVKADAGTYGMAVMTVRNVSELKSLNRKQRTRMATTKGGQAVDRVIIQEGVYTFETLDDAVAEPVVYLLGQQVIGGFYRLHKNRGIDENLNSPGMQFEPIAFPLACNEPCREKLSTPYKNRYYLYGIVAQLSMLAAAREMKDQMT
jgi:glutamate--cysteine ligase